jgi:hypothetical protein
MDTVGRLPLLAGAVLLASCATAPGGYVAGDPSDDVSGIETSLTVEPTRISRDQGATIEITVANTTDRDVRIRFPDQRQIVLLVLDSLGDVTFTDDRTIAVPTYLLVGALQDWHYTIDWDGRVDIGGRRLELLPGHYQLQAGLRRAGALYVNRTAPVDIEVTGAPGGHD